MRGKNTITINGRLYDATTGLPIDTATTPRPTSPVTKPGSMDVIRPKPKTPVATVNHHVTKPQHSQTLRRDIVKKPISPIEKSRAARERLHQTVPKSPTVTRFAAHPQALVRGDTAVKPAPEPVILSHVIKKAHTVAAAKKPAPKPKTAALSSRELKEKLIAEHLAEATPHAARRVKTPRRRALPRSVSIVAACFGVVVLAGYLTYLNMPSLSLRVAASQAGIAAKYPEYHPDGYRFDGPIAYSPGSVTIKFQSNSGDQEYAISQQNSSWDSQAVLDNYVLKNTESYLTYSEQGLTIYTYDNNAAWVNGGILYTVEGDAPLSNQQVLRIAASM